MSPDGVNAISVGLAGHETGIKVAYTYALRVIQVSVLNSA